MGKLKNLIELKTAEKITDTTLAFFVVISKAVAPVSIAGGICLLIAMVFKILTRVQL
jgi:hypothetical protein